MNRKYVHRGRVVDGVYQRCKDFCPQGWLPIRAQMGVLH